METITYPKRIIVKFTLADDKRSARSISLLFDRRYCIFENIEKSKQYALSRYRVYSIGSVILKY